MKSRWAGRSITVVSDHYFRFIDTSLAIRINASLRINNSIMVQSYISTDSEWRDFRKTAHHLLMASRFMKCHARPILAPSHAKPSRIRNNPKRGTRRSSRTLESPLLIHLMQYVLRFDSFRQVAIVLFGVFYGVEPTQSSSASLSSHSPQRNGEKLVRGVWQTGSSLFSLYSTVADRTRKHVAHTRVLELIGRDFR